MEVASAAGRRACFGCKPRAAAGLRHSHRPLPDGRYIISVKAPAAGTRSSQPDSGIHRLPLLSTGLNLFQPVSTSFFKKFMRRESGQSARSGEKLEPTHVGCYKLRSLALADVPLVLLGKLSHYPVCDSQSFPSFPMNSHGFPSLLLKILRAKNMKGEICKKANENAKIKPD